MLLIGIGALAVLAIAGVLIATLFRRVVSTNEVHIVQYHNKTMSYGTGRETGNAYYEWPRWMPLFGVTKIVLPVSVFDLEVKSYEAYDEGRLPFNVDVMAFFRVSDSNQAAERITSFDELHQHLVAVVKGAIRSVLASNSIDEIMQGRSKFGQQFTDEVREQLKQWGVEPVKNIELMDIRDADGSHVIQNIMAKKKSFIEMQSKVEVAANNKTAKLAEIEAAREVDVKGYEAQKSIGMQKVQSKLEVDLADQSALQRVKDAAKQTKEKEMAITSVEVNRNAEIKAQAALTLAEQDKQTAILSAEARLKSTELEAAGISAKGLAEAEADKARLLAPVEAQTTLAKEIGANQNYQSYLVTLEKVKATKEIGVAQASALDKAEIKIIVNGGSPVDGVTKVMDLFSSKGGTEIGAMLEGLANTETGQNLLKKFGVAKDN